METAESAPRIQLRQNKNFRGIHNMRKKVLHYLLVSAAGVAVSLVPANVLAGAGDLYVSDLGTNSILKFTPAGTKSTFVSGLNNPEGLVFDAQGNLFEADNGSNTIFKFTPNGTQSVFASGLTDPTALAIDAQGNLYEADFGSGNICKFTPAGSKSTFATGLAQPMGLAFDSSGNLFASDTTGNAIYKITPGGVKSTLVSGLNGPLGLVFDASGNLYEGEGLPLDNNDTIFKIKFNSDGTIASRTAWAKQLNYPWSLAINSSGTLFEGDWGNQTIYKFTANGAKSIFASASQPAGLAFEPAIQFHVLATVALPTTANAAVAVNQALNKVYASGGASAGQDVVVIDGATFATTDLGAGSGSGANVDIKSDRYWAGTVSGGSVIVRDGITNATLATVPLLGACPIETTYDFKKNRIWVGSQCGNGNDPVFAIDANSFQVVSGTPVGSGGAMGSIIANGNNGRLYLTASGASKRVNPTTFAVTSNAFGTVMAINTLVNKLYAASGNNLQIINGAPDPETFTTIALSYTPPSMGINTELNHLYLANPNASCVEVRNGTTGAVIATFPLSSFGVVPNGPMTVDSVRGRVYLIASSGSGPVLLVIEDLTTAHNSSANLGS
jgi:hypothetical protein